MSNLIDAEHPFWCGPDSSVAPHLPVGSPERAALFAELRQTFAEDWAAAERSLPAEKRAKMGDLYFIRVGEFIKIGRTTNLDARIRMIDCHAATALELLGVIVGAGYLERSWHKTFRHLRSKGEWFRETPELCQAIEMASTTPETPK